MDSTLYTDSTSSSRKKSWKNRQTHQNWNTKMAILLTSIPLKILVVSRNTQRLIRWVCIFLATWWFILISLVDFTSLNTPLVYTQQTHSLFHCIADFCVLFDEMPWAKQKPIGVHSEWTQLFFLSPSLETTCFDSFCLKKSRSNKVTFFTPKIFMNL